MLIFFGSVIVGMMTGLIVAFVLKRSSSYRNEDKIFVKDDSKSKSI